MSDKNNECDPDEQQQVQPTMLGWIARMVSLALLLLLAGTIVYQIIQPHKDIAFNVSVKSDEIREQGGAYLIPIDVTNVGTDTARDVKLSLETGSETTDIEMKMIGQKETITFVVSSPDRVTSVSHEIISYEAP